METDKIGLSNFACHNESCDLAFYIDITLACYMLILCNSMSLILVMGLNIFLVWLYIENANYLVTF